MMYSTGSCISDDAQKNFDHSANTSQLLAWHSEMRFQCRWLLISFVKIKFIGLGTCKFYKDEFCNFYNLVTFDGKLIVWSKILQSKRGFPSYYKSYIPLFCRDCFGPKIFGKKLCKSWRHDLSSKSAALTLIEVFLLLEGKFTPSSSALKMSFLIHFH